MCVRRKEKKALTWYPGGRMRESIPNGARRRFMKTLGRVPIPVIFLLAMTAAWAQDTATIVGTVADSSGAVIPGAKVTVTNADKGFTRELVSNTAGDYTAAKIPIGSYVVSAEASGFQTSVRAGISLSVGQTLRVDFQMSLGQVTQQVTVTGNLPHVETETAALSDVITGNQIQNLELNGRNFTALALLVP